MRFQFLLVPAALSAAAPAYGYEYLSLAQAQAVLFPGARFTPRDMTLSIAQIDALMKAGPGNLVSAKVKAWRVSTGGWLFLDQVIGRNDRISYVVGIGADGTIKGIEVLVCIPEYDGIRQPKWIGQFLGRRHSNADLTSIVEYISGVTLSSEHITQGVRRILATYALFYAPKAE